MAVYEGARTRGTALPAGARPVVQRRHARIPERARRRGRPVTVVLAVIVVLLFFGLLYLTQTLQAAVTSYQISNLLLDRQTLQQELQSQQGDVAQWGSEPQVLGWAGQEGLLRLGKPLRLPSR